MSPTTLARLKDFREPMSKSTIKGCGASKTQLNVDLTAGASLKPFVLHCLPRRHCPQGVKPPTSPNFSLWTTRGQTIPPLPTMVGDPQCHLSLLSLSATALRP